MVGIGEGDLLGQEASSSPGGAGNASAVRLQNAGEDLQQGGFAGSVQAGDQPLLPGAYSDRCRGEPTLDNYISRDENGTRVCRCCFPCRHRSGQSIEGQIFRRLPHLPRSEVLQLRASVIHPPGDDLGVAVGVELFRCASFGAWFAALMSHGMAFMERCGESFELGLFGLKLIDPAGPRLCLVLPEISVGTGEAGNTDSGPGAVIAQLLSDYLRDRCWIQIDQSGHRFVEEGAIMARDKHRIVPCGQRGAQVFRSCVVQVVRRFI